MDEDKPTKGNVIHDSVVHHPLGGGSYIFKSNFVDYVDNGLSKDKVRVSIISRTNT